MYRFASLVITEAGALFTVDPSFPNEDAVGTGKIRISG